MTEGRSQTPSRTSGKASEHPLPPSDDGHLFPTETEIYILPNGQVIFADLPAEMAGLVDELGGVERDRD
jgi:hypothetical protein